MGAESLGRHQLNWALERFFQEEGDPHEVVKALPTRIELQQKIDIARWHLFFADKRAEQAQAFDSE